MPARRPAGIRELEGDRKHRTKPEKARQQAEPTPTIGAPAVPEWLPEEAHEHWAYLVPLLADMRVLSVADGLALALLCNELVRYLEADKEVRENGTTQVCQSGYEQVTPAVTTRTGALKQVIGLLARFGLTPADRTRVAAIKGKDNKPNPLAEVLSATQRRRKR
jgi:P27 family predicted phage terminase small subunit